MAYPAGVKTTQLLVGGGSVSGLGVPALVRVFVRPSHFLVWAVDGSPVIPVQEELPHSSAVVLNLPQVDQAGFLDQSGRAFNGWAYTVTAYYRVEGSITDYVVSKTVQPVAGQSALDFELIVDGVAAEPVVGDLGVVTSVNGLTGAVVLEAGGGGGGVTSYNDLTDKPLIPSQPADIGAQPSGDYVLDDDTRLADARTPTQHDHTVSDVSGLQSALNSKQAAGSYAAATHSHTVANVTGLQAALDAKANTGDVAPAATRMDYVRKAGATWGARPTSDPAVVVIWIGADPSPAIVTTGTAGMRDNIDVRWVTP